MDDTTIAVTIAVAAIVVLAPVAWFLYVRSRGFDITHWGKQPPKEESPKIEVKVEEPPEPTYQEKCERDPSLWTCLVGERGSEKIQDDAICASSYWQNRGDHGNGQMWRSRIDNTQTTWCSTWPDANQWIQWDFGNLKCIMAAITAGRANERQWVEAYRLEYSTDASNWQAHPEQFSGNTDTVTPVENLIEPPIKARYLRLHPTKWHSHISMRAEFKGFDVEDSKA
jgi:hypothetical protein